MPTWGPYLPKFQSGGVTRARPKNWEEFETDYGPPLLSKRGTAAESPLSAEFNCSHQEADLVDDFFDTDCEAGTLNFEKDGATYRWAAPPSRVDRGHRATVSVSWLRQPT